MGDKKEAVKAEKANAYDKSNDINLPPDVEIDGSCVGHIRPHDKYQQELGYGFDWMRVGDTETNGIREHYNEMVGNIYRRSDNMLKIDINESDCIIEHRLVKNGMYACLENEYNMASGSKVFIKVEKSRDRYYVPILCLRKSEIKKTVEQKLYEARNKKQVKPETYIIFSATLELRLSIKVKPQKLYWVLPEEHQYKNSEDNEMPIRISPLNVPATTGEHKMEFDVRCSKPITREIDVKLMAEYQGGKKKLVGAFRIWKNKITRPKVVLVNVLTDKIKEGKKEGDDTANNSEAVQYSKAEIQTYKKTFEKYLYPALIYPSIEVKKLDMTSAWHPFKKDLSRYKGEKGLIVENTVRKTNPIEMGDIYDDLKAAFKDKYDGYDDDLLVFMIKQDAWKYTQKSKRGGGRESVHNPFFAAYHHHSLYIAHR